MAILTLCLLFLLVGSSLGSDHHQNLPGLCIESEKAALLNFIQGFNRSARFASWRVDEDCCKWKGVACNNRTGHIHTLDLRSQNSTDFLQGELRDSLLNLPYLTHLDLSLNDFRQERVPEFIGSLENLEYLNLSNANLRGRIPSQLGNLSKLQSLDLSGNDHNLRTDSLDWLLGKSDLRVLDLEGVDLGDVVNWLDTVNRLSSLRTLSLSACRINLLPASLPSVNFTSLEILDLSFNDFNSTIPDWLFNMSHNLVHINLTRSQLVGPIPNAFGKLTSLTSLDLSENLLTAEIPTTLTSSLKKLNLSYNQLEGSFVKSIANLSRLVVLDVSSNSLKDIFHEDQLLNLGDLRMLDLSSNDITFNMSSRWLPPFRLDVIRLRSCRLGPKFPRWLQTQKDLSSIDISSAGISDIIPHWFWNLSFNLVYMDLSNNTLSGKIPDFSSKPNLSVLDMSDNNFTGPITSICKSLVANNKLRSLDLSHNFLSGPLPDCWKHGESLVRLSLAKNNLSGRIPSSIRHLIHLKVLSLHMNYFSGELPSSLRYLNNLLLIDLGENTLSGKIPPWIGESSVNLLFLILRSNNFSGKIPPLLCQLKHLVVLDLGRNHLSGNIPMCIDNFFAMARIDAEPSYVYKLQTIYEGLLLLIDLSMNQLSGEIPVELTRLVGLISLNLSHNNLTGAIPSAIGALKDLEVLDLSGNKLSCCIPPEMANLTFLSILNLSYNNLSGKIPSERQLATFEASSFMKNEKLCGPPLEKACSEPFYEDPQCRDKNQQNMEREDQDHDELPSFYIRMGIGFMTAIWVYWTVLLLNESWREAYLKLLDKVVEQILVTATVIGARLRTKLEKLVSR